MKELETLINRNSIENGSNTPDFILAKYLMACLNAFENALGSRDRWYSGAKDAQSTKFLSHDDVVTTLGSHGFDGVGRRLTAIRRGDVKNQKQK